MKFSLLFTCGLVFIGYLTVAQDKKRSIFNEINLKQQALPNKHTLVYTYLTWCQGNREDIEAIQPVLNEYRNRFNLIILVDSTKLNQASKLIIDLKPDAYVYLNGYYKNSLKSHKAMRKSDHDFCTYYNMKVEKYAGLGPAGLYVEDCNHKLVKSGFRIVNRAEELKSYLETISENCPD